MFDDDVETCVQTTAWATVVCFDMARIGYLL